MFNAKRLVGLFGAVLCAVTPVIARAELLLPGVLAEYYSFGSTSLSAMPDLDLLVPDEVLIVDQIDHAATYEAWDGLGSAFLDNFAARYTALLDVPADGDYAFVLESDDGSCLYVDGGLVIDNSSLHSMNRVTGQARLSAGCHVLVLDYFEKDGQAGLRLSWSGPGVSGVITDANLLQDVSVDLESYAGLYGIPEELLAEFAVGGTSGGPSTNSIVFADLGPGLQVEYCSFRTNPLSALPDFSAFSPHRIDVRENLVYARREIFNGFDYDYEFTGSFASRHFGFFYAAAAGSYGFRLRSDDGSRLFVDGTLVADNDGIHGDTSVDGSIVLAAGLHEIEILFFGQRSDCVLELQWTPPGASGFRVIPSSVLYHAEPLNFAPCVSMTSPAAGSVYAALEPVTLTAEASDLDGAVVSVAFRTAAGELVGVASNAPWSVVWRPSAGGMTDVYAVATDDLGGVRRSPSVSVDVRLPPSGTATGLRATFQQGLSAYERRMVESRLAELRRRTGVAVDLESLGEADRAFVYQDAGPHYDETFETILPTVAFAPAQTAWTGLPAWMINNYTAVLTGYLYVEKADFYTFELSSDDGAELWLDGGVLIGHTAAHSYTASYGSVYLAPGLHPIRIEYFEDEGWAGLTLAWSSSIFARRLVAPYELVHVPEGVDTDGDGMDDWWEEHYGFDAEDPSDATPDSDGDGVSNLDEFRLGTNPRSRDTDGDGLPDGWEIVRGTLPLIHDALGDTDGDGLANIDEYRAGTRPDLADTDGDGLDDRVEYAELGTDAMVADFVTTGAPEIAVPLTNAFAISVATTGVYAVSVTVAQEWHDYGSVKVDMPSYDRVLFAVDGHEYAWRDIGVDVDRPSTVVFHTPILGEGVHWVSVGFGHPEYRLKTFAVYLSAARCLDLDLEDVARRRNRVRGDLVSSRVSPAFVEGDARFPWRVSSDAGTVRPSGVGSWYLDVPLEAETSSVVTVCFEDAVSTNITVRWEATNPFANDDSVMMRAGSSLLFAGCPDGLTNGFVRIETNGVFACGYSGTGFAALEFPEGEFDVVAVYGRDGEVETERTGALHVRAVAGRFSAERPACLVGVVRSWRCPDLPGESECVVTGDDRTMIGWTASGDLNLAVVDTRGERMVTARISEGGPVLDCRAVDPLWAVAAYGNIALAIETNELGVVCRSVLSQHGASADVGFRIESFQSSVLMDDLTTFRMVGPKSFDAAGRYIYDLIKPESAPSPCHSVFVYQGSERIGEVVYGNGPMPEEWR